MKRLIAAGAAALSLSVVVPVTARADSAFCKEAKNMKGLDSLLNNIDPTTDPKGAAKKLNTAIKTVKKFEKASPKSIKKDVASLRAFMESFAKILPKFPTGPDATNLAKLQPIMADLAKLQTDMTKLDATSKRVNAFVKKECKITLGS